MPIPQRLGLKLPITNYQITNYKLNDSSSRRSAHFLHAVHQLFSDRVERAGLCVGALDRDAEPSGAEFGHVRVWRGSSPRAGGARRTISGRTGHGCVAVVYLDVSARFILTRGWEHARSVDFRRQRRRLSGALRLSTFLPRLRTCRWRDPHLAKPKLEAANGWRE